jgi:hypothetical protein
MKKKDKGNILLERTIKKFLNLLSEQKPGEAIPTPIAAAATPGPTSGVSDIGTTVSPERPALPAPAGTEPVKGKTLQSQNVKFYSTKDLFTTQYPSNSAEWVNETKKKPWMIPLQDGRIAQKLEKLFPTFSGASAAAARYNDFQFRVTLNGDLKANVKIKVIAKGSEPNKATAYLESIEIPNQAKLPEKGSDPSSLDRIKKKGAIDIEANIDDLMQWATGTKPAERADRIEKMMDKVYDNASSNIKSSIAKDSPKLKEIAKSITTDISRGAIKNRESEINKELFKKLKTVAAEEPETIEKAPEETPFFEKMVDTVVAMYDAKQKEGKLPDRKSSKWKPGEKVNNAEAFVKKLLKKYPDFTPEDETDAATFAASESPSKKKEEVYSINLHSFLKNLLLEKKSAEKRGELEHAKGGKIINKINDQIFDLWFAKKGKGIAAAATDRLFFEGNMYQWFAVEKATFVPKKREGETKGEDVELILDGQLVMESQIWIDARCGETGGINHWNFYVWDRATPIGKASYMIPPVETLAAGVAGRTRQ